jgi:hypothetical protein
LKFLDRIRCLLGPMGDEDKRATIYDKWPHHWRYSGDRHNRHGSGTSLSVMRSDQSKNAAAMLHLAFGCTK